MERVLYNLLLNAAQVSPPRGSVTVKTRQVGDMVEIAVIDRGPGIDPKIWKAYSIPSSLRNRAASDSGLRSSRRFVDEHGGSISVKSEREAASVFESMSHSERTLHEGDSSGCGRRRKTPACCELQLKTAGSKWTRPASARRSDEVHRSRRRHSHGLVFRAAAAGIVGQSSPSGFAHARHLMTAFGSIENRRLKHEGGCGDFLPSLFARSSDDRGEQDARAADLRDENRELRELTWAAL